MPDRHTELVSEGPRRYRVTFEADGDAGSVEFDERLRAVDVSPTET